MENSVTMDEFNKNPSIPPLSVDEINGLKQGILPDRYKLPSNNAPTNTDTSDDSDASSEPVQAATPTTQSKSGLGSLQDSFAKLKDLISSSSNSMDQAKNMSVTKDQLDALSKHAGANQWTNMFMNLIGSANNVSAKDAIDVNNESLNSQYRNLMLQNQTAAQKAQQAKEEQGFGLDQIKETQMLGQLGLQQAPITPLQQQLGMTLAKSAGVEPNVAGISNTTSNQQFSNIYPQLKEAADIKNKQIQMQNMNEYYKQKGIEKIPVQNPDGSIGYAFVPKSDPTNVQDIPTSVLPQSQKITQQDAQNMLKRVTPEVIVAHQAVKNYDTALDGLNPSEATQANNLANRQISAIAGKFDQGVKANVITNANQLLNSIVKLEQTGEFDTPENPAIGQAAFRRVKSALEFAAATQAGKVRPSNFQTQFSLGNSFGSNVAGQPVPQEKIEELKNETRQNIGGVLQQALSGSNNQQYVKGRLNEIFGNDADDYLDNFHNIQGPANVQKQSIMKQQQQQNPNQKVVLPGVKQFSTSDDLLNHIQNGG